MTLSERDRAALREQFLQELQEEHARRLKAFEARRARLRRRSRSAEHAFLDEAAALREQVREEFYKANGYQLYTDSSGRQVWLPPEEYEWRTRRRRRRTRRRRTTDAGRGIDRRTAAIYAAVVLLAITCGVFLVR